MVRGCWNITQDNIPSGRTTSSCRTIESYEVAGASLGYHPTVRTFLLALPARLAGLSDCSPPGLSLALELDEANSPRVPHVRVCTRLNLQALHAPSGAIRLRNVLRHLPQSLGQCFRRDAGSQQHHAVLWEAATVASSASKLGKHSLQLSMDMADFLPCQASKKPMDEEPLSNL